MKLFYKTSFKIAKLILFIIFAYLLFLQVKKINIEILFNLNIKNLYFFGLAIILIPLNYYLEFLKWNITLKKIEFNTTLKIKINSFMSGILSGFLTPNLIGNFIGRMYYFDRNKRISIILLTSVSNLSQFYSSIFIGGLSLFLLPPPPFMSWVNIYYLLILFLLTIFISVYFYLYFEKLYKFFKIKKRLFIRFETIMKNTITLRIKYLILSNLRFLIFSSQYILFLLSLGINFSHEIIFIVFGVYFWSTLIPSFWFGKIFIRESVAIFLFGFYNYSTEIVLTTALCIWLGNQLIPALISIPFLKLKR